MKNPKEVGQFNKRVKELRKKAGLTQEALAFEADINTRTLQRIEAGDQGVTIDLFFSLTRALQLQPADFFEGFTIKIEE